MLSQVVENATKIQRMVSPNSPNSAYIHIPFCRRRCYYCDFPISVVGNHVQAGKSGTIEQYVDILCQEIAVTPRLDFLEEMPRSPQIDDIDDVAARASDVSAFGDRSAEAHGRSLSGVVSRTVSSSIKLDESSTGSCPQDRQMLATVFFGGGTPSLLSAAQLHRILDTLDQQFGLQAGAEISMEVDPGTFTLKQLQGYQAAGVNRVSIGAQAFQPELLAACGRSHSVAQIYEAVEIVRQVGLTNFNLDLISGLPNQTLEHWQASLNATIALAPTHVSTYDLTIEPGTVFSRQYQPGDGPLPTEETTAQMYQLAGQILPKVGYEHYEISNYARPGYQCCHNQVYWENRPYFGFGMGATSYIQQQRFTRPRTRQAYFQWVEELTKSGGMIDSPKSTINEVLLETLMLGLRLAKGLDLDTLSRQFGAKPIKQILSCLTPYFHKGWVELVEPSSSHRSRIRLSDPDGFLFSNIILVALWTELEEAA